MQEQKSVHCAVIPKVYENNSKFLPQNLFPLGHPKKNHPVILCQLSSRLYQELIFPPKSIINIGGLAGLQSLSSFRHIWESATPASTHRPTLATVGRSADDH